ncbi:MAG: L-serine ammonia-lyase, iron-sulfur-dependent, subunit beta, partial [Clostridiales bacterium]|nr:L-serine ammonia-lyase, iron-sulfur-dependent, subunit beta [Clostridiales bacterium]
AKTYKGHGTDKALLAGVMGFAVDDERIRDAYLLAAKRGFEYSFSEIDLPDAHENSVKITMFFKDGDSCEVIGSSIGGGQIVIKSIDDFNTDFSANSNTLIIKQWDKKGVISDISYILTVSDINIGVMKISRVEKGGTALSIIETDSHVPDRVLGILKDTPNVLLAISVNLSNEDEGE